MVWNLLFSATVSNVQCRYAGLTCGSHCNAVLWKGEDKIFRVRQGASTRLLWRLCMSDRKQNRLDDLHKWWGKWNCFVHRLLCCCFHKRRISFYILKTSAGGCSFAKIGTALHLDCTHQVPVLVDGEHVVCDSFEIARYLERSYPDAPSLFGKAGESGCLFVSAYSDAIMKREPPFKPSLSCLGAFLEWGYLYLGASMQIYLIETSLCVCRILPTDYAEYLGTAWQGECCLF